MNWCRSKERDLNASQNILQAYINSAGQNTHLQQRKRECLARLLPNNECSTNHVPNEGSAKSQIECPTRRLQHQCLPKAPINTNSSLIRSFSENSASHVVQYYVQV